MSQQASEVCAYIEDTREELVELLADLVAENTVAGNEAAGQEVIIDEFESLGLDPDVWEPDADALRGHPGFFETTSYKEHGYEGRPNVAATVEGSGGGRSLTFSGHIDVVPAEPEDEWTHGPWNPTVEDGKMYGRGTGDAKGGIASFVHAYRALDAVGVDLAGDLTLQTTIEEEDGGVGGVLSALERGYQPDAAIITEPYHVPNIAIASAGVMFFKITVPGRTAHAARGYLGVNAIEKAMTVIDALDELDQERKDRISFEPAVRLDENARGHETNINVGVIDGGDWPAIVPGKVTLEGRVGWPPGESREEVREQIENAVATAAEDDEWLSENPPEVEWFGWNAEPHQVDTDEPVVQLAKEHAEAVTGGETQFIGGTAALDERYYNLYYDIPCPSVGPKGYYPHGTDEYVIVDSLVETAKVLALTAMDWCGVEDRN